MSRRRFALLLALSLCCSPTTIYLLWPRPAEPDPIQIWLLDYSAKRAQAKQGVSVHQNRDGQADHDRTSNSSTQRDTALLIDTDEHLSGLIDEYGQGAETPGRH